MNLKNFKDTLKIISYIGIILLAFIFISSAIKSNSTTIVRTSSFNIPTPSKIVLYSNGKVKTLNSKDKSFNNALNLISERLGSMKSFNVEKVNDSIDNYTYNEKKSFRCMQLLYSENATINLQSSNDSLELKFNKLHLLIAADNNQNYGINLVYGDDKNTTILKEESSPKEVMCKLLRIINNEIH